MKATKVTITKAGWNPKDHYDRVTISLEIEFEDEKVAVATDAALKTICKELSRLGQTYSPIVIKEVQS